MDAQKITDGAAAAGFFPFFVIDGRMLPRQIVEVFDRGEQAKVPLLAGFNSGEIRSLRALAPPVPADAATYEKEIRARYADLADAFLKLYPASDLQESIWATTRDSLYGWTAERLATKQTALGVPSFLYLFDHGYPAADDEGPARLPRQRDSLRVRHARTRRRRTGRKVPETPVETQSLRRHARLLGVVRAHRRAERRRTAAVASLRHGRAPTWLSKTRRAPKTHLLPGMYELNEQVVCRRRAAGGIPWHWNVGLASPPLPRRGAHADDRRRDAIVSR